MPITQAYLYICLNINPQLQNSHLKVLCDLIPDLSCLPCNQNPDLPGYQTTEIDQKLYEVYGDNIHQNNGTNLDGGFEDAEEWAAQWRCLVSLPKKSCDGPKGKVGQKFTTLLAVEVNDVLDRKSNAE